MLVNNAGILLYGNFHEIPLERQELLVNLNLIAYFKLMRLFLPDMVDAKEGRILNIVSTAAFQPTVHHATYGASKAFVQSLSQAVNQEIKGTGVKVFTLTGGEVFLRKDVLAIVERIKQRGMQCHMITNGMLLSKATVARLVELSDRVCRFVFPGLLTLVAFYAFAYQTFV